MSMAATPGKMSLPSSHWLNVSKQVGKGTVRTRANTTRLDISASMRIPDDVVIRGATLSDLLRTHAEAHVGPEATPERRRFLPPGTDLSNVQLSSAKLAWADLREVCLSSADLSDADLTLDR